MSKIALYEYYEDNEARKLAHAAKGNDLASIAKMAKEMANELKGEAVYLIPVPNSSGRAEYTLRLAEHMVVAHGNARVMDILESEPREPIYDAKKAGRTVEFSFHKRQEISIPDNAVLIDNVIGTGRTMVLARKALGKNVPVLAYAKDSKALLYANKLEESILTEKARIGTDIMIETPKIGKELAEFWEDVLDEYYGIEPEPEVERRHPIKTFRDSSPLATPILPDVAKPNSNISWRKVANLPYPDLITAYSERFRSNVFFIDGVANNKLILKFPLNDSVQKIPLEAYSKTARELNREELYQLSIEMHRENSMKRDIDTVQSKFPNAFLKKISDKNHFAVYSNREPLSGQRLSLDPFEGKTATTREQAWKEAATKVMNLTKSQGIGY